MSIVKNPYGVGMSGKDVVELKTTCACCAMEFGFKAPRTAHVVPKRCQPCEGHKLDGIAAERMTALEDHATRALERVRWAMDKAREMAEEKKIAFEDHKMSQWASFRSHKRREWAEKRLAAILDVHTDSETVGMCGCGLASPCPTRRALEEFDWDNPHPDYAGFIYEPPRARPRFPLRRPQSKLGNGPTP